MLRIGIVAGEASGDFLAADLIRHLRDRHPEVQVEGIGGPQLEAAGCRILYPMDRLAVMGLVEVAGRYFELAGIRCQLRQHFLMNPPDLFIGVDAPDFNLGLELALREKGIRTVHYVSPSVWAWRGYRIHKIKRAVDRMLVLFPFEQAVYQQHGIDVRFVGHPLADRIPPAQDRAAARQRLGIRTDSRLIALMPGSRASEIERMYPVQLQTARWCLERSPGLEFVTGVLGEQAQAMVERIRDRVAPGLPLGIYRDRTADILASADAAMLTSGTITLEAMLYDLPMVVGYRMHWLTWRIVRALVSIRYASLPNLLADRPLVAEFLQQDCRPELAGAELLHLLEDAPAVAAIRAVYGQIRRQIQRDAGASAAGAILELAGSR